MAFKLTKVAYQVYDPATQTSREETSTDPALLSAAATFAPASGVRDSTTPGIYQTQMTVHKLQDKRITRVWFDAEDEGVFRPW